MYQRVGTRFGDFAIKNLLGAGGMAAVYLAIHAPSGQQCALKILSSQLSHIESFRQRFELEAQITARLEHPNIVPVIAFGAVEDALYLAMQYLSGGTLHDKFVIDGAVSLQNTANYLTDIAAALDYAHQHGVIHRDLKLANVLLDENGRALLSDFGIARLLDTTLHLTASGSVLGSPHYMSPEQNEGRTLDSRSDLYSFAVMAFLMVTGQFPFHADTPVAIALQHVTKEPPRPSEWNPQLPIALDGVLLKGLAKKPDDRFQTAAEFASAFVRAIGDCDTQTLVNLPMLSRSRRTPPRGPTPSTLPPLPIAIPIPVHEPTSQMIRTPRRSRFVLLIVAASVAFVCAGALLLGQFGGVRGLFAPTPLPDTPASVYPVTTTPLRVSTLPTTPATAPPTSAAQGSPYTAIIKGVDKPSNVRGAPDIAAAVVAQMYVQDTAIVQSRTPGTNVQDIWFLIKMPNGLSGWVRGDVVELLPIGTDPQNVPIAAVIPTVIVNITPIRLTPRPSPTALR